MTELLPTSSESAEPKYKKYRRMIVEQVLNDPEARIREEIDRTLGENGWAQGFNTRLITLQTALGQLERYEVIDHEKYGNFIAMIKEVETANEQLIAKVGITEPSEEVRTYYIGKLKDLAQEILVAIPE